MVTDVSSSPVHYRLLSEHFQACAELSEQEREEYLSGPNVGDHLLREELRSLLKFHARPAADQDTPRAVKSTEVQAPPASPGRTFLIPFVILGTSTVLLVLLVRGWTLGRLERSYREEGVRRLQQILESRIASIRAWATRQKELARSVLEDPEIVPHVATLVEAIQGLGADEEAIRSSASYPLISERMSQVRGGLGDAGFCILNPAGLVLCSSANVAAGHTAFPGSAANLRSLASGEWTVSRPYRDPQLGPTMYVGGPVRGANGQVIAFGLFFFSPRTEFYRHLSPSGSAELLAFDERSLLLNDLKRIPGLDSGQTALRVQLRDPGGEWTGAPPIDSVPDHWPPTRMCLSAIQGRSGSDSTGYRNFVGRPVVGTWSWLPEQEMGIGVEEDLEELLAPLQPLKSGFAFLMTIPAVLMGCLFFAFGRVRFPRGGKEARYGYYVVERPIGHGGMGDVFLANHSILSRPAALKILRDRRPNATTIARFKREARMASRLGHPNSIQIFDYGETADGRLYYAMEYVEGLNLAQLLTLEGPFSVARALYLLKQISGALEEAHALGLLHRDLKPSNVMVGMKGGLGDVVKILDFGIASSVSGIADDITRSTNLVGTPVYIAPERIRRPDQLDFRSDVYSFGGVAFHMLTGRSIFEGPGPAEVMYQVLTAKRPSPSKLRGEPLPEPLEALILDCLAIEPELRPSSMRELTESLKSIETPESWSQDEARSWWAANKDRLAGFRSTSP